MQPGMQGAASITGQIGGQLSVVDPSSGQSVSGQVWGNFAAQAAIDPNQAIAIAQRDLLGAVNRVIADKLGRGQIAVPTIAHSLPALAGEIIQASGLAQQGIQVTVLELHANVQAPPGPAAYAGPLPPDPMQATANAYKQALADELDPRNRDYELRVNVGGFKLKASTDEGFDAAGLKKQVTDEAKSTAIWWAAGCAIMAVVGIGVLAVAWYVYTEVMATSRGEIAATGKDVQAASWDGKTPFSCGAGQNLRLSGVTATLASGTAITAAANCKLELSGVDVTAPTALSVLGNAEVTVKGGRLAGSVYAVQALGNAKVVLEGTQVEGKTQKLGPATITGL